MKEKIKRKTPETKSPNSHPCELSIGDGPANLLEIGYFLANGNSKAEIRLNGQILWINSIDKDGTATANFTDRLDYNSQGKGWQEVQIQLTEKDGQILINTPNFDDAQKAFFGLQIENLDDLKWGRSIDPNMEDNVGRIIVGVINPSSWFNR